MTILKIRIALLFSINRINDRKHNVRGKENFQDSIHSRAYDLVKKLCVLLNI